MDKFKPKTWKEIAQHISVIEGETVSPHVVRRSYRLALKKLSKELADDPLVKDWLCEDSWDNDKRESRISSDSWWAPSSSG